MSNSIEGISILSQRVRRGLMSLGFAAIVVAGSGCATISERAKVVRDENPITDVRESATATPLTFDKYILESGEDGSDNKIFIEAFNSYELGKDFPTLSDEYLKITNKLINIDSRYNQAVAAYNLSMNASDERNAELIEEDLTRVKVEYVKVIIEMLLSLSEEDLVALNLPVKMQVEGFDWNSLMEAIADDRDIANNETMILLYDAIMNAI